MWNVKARPTTSWAKAAPAGIPNAAHRLLREHRQRARPGMAMRGFALPARFRGTGTEAPRAGPLQHLPHPPALPPGPAPGGLRLGASSVARSQAAPRDPPGHRFDHVGVQLRHAQYCRPGHRGGLRHLSARVGPGFRDRQADREVLASLGRKRVRKGSKDDWTHPHDPDAAAAGCRTGAAI